MKKSTALKVAVVIPNFNGADFLRSAIDSLLSQSLPATIIVVENGSTDASKNILADYGDAIVPIFNTENLGFAGGVNCGIRYGIDHEYDAVALFNNDAVADTEWLSTLVHRLESDAELGIITSRIELDGTKNLDSTGEFYTTWGMPYPRGRHLPIADFSESGYIFGASGGASIYRCAMLKQIGLFDETFFAYYEDTDVSFRAQLAGWKVYYESAAIARHRQGATTKRMVKGFAVRQTFKNLPMLFWKNVPTSMIPAIGIRFALVYTLILGNAMTHGNAKMALSGVFRAITLIPHTFQQRRAIQSSKKVSNEYITSILIHDLPPDQTGVRKLRKIFLRK